MKVISAVTGRKAIHQAIGDLLMEGAVVAPRGVKTLEISPTLFEIYNPTDVLPTGINRAKLHPPIGAAEALQGIGGISCPKLMVRIAPNFKMFLNGSGSFDGAYGPRLYQQLDAAYRRLKDDDNTRQAVATIWNEGDALREGSKDYPCTLDLHFLVRGGDVYLHVTMRSNDIWWGTPYDFFQFTQIQLTMANCLNLGAGTYYHKANSLHMYERDFEDAAKLFPETHYARHIVEGIGHPGMTWQEVSSRARLILRGRRPYNTTRSEEWYLQQLAPYTNGSLT